MVRNYKRRTMQGNTDPKTMLEAARCVKIHGISRRQVSCKYGIKYRTLSKYIRKFSDEDIYGSHATPSINVGYQGANIQVLSTELEVKLVEYVIKATNVSFGLSTVQIRKMSYELARSRNVRVPPTWNETKMAGFDWYGGFMKRHPGLQANMDKVMIVSRSNSYGQAKVDMFFSKLQDLANRCQFKASNIWDMQEYGVSLNDVPNRVISRSYGHLKRQKDFVTLAVTIRADGERMAPEFIFPTEKVLQKLEDNDTDETDRLKVSNWMDEEKFLNYLEHFVGLSHCSKSNPCLLIIDNQCYLSIKAIDYAEEHGLALLSFPKCCSHRLQPLLDQLVYANFNDSISKACQLWSSRSKKRKLTERDISRLVQQNYRDIFAPDLIRAAFKNRGIYPPNKLVLSDMESEEMRTQAKAYDDVDLDEDESAESEDEDEDDDDDDDEDFNLENNVFYENMMSELLIGGLVDQSHEVEKQSEEQKEVIALERKV